jgi:hypothetical protein
MNFAGVWTFTATEILSYHFKIHLNQLSHSEDGGSIFLRKDITLNH